MESQWMYDEYRQVGVDYMDESEVHSYDEAMRSLGGLVESSDTPVDVLSLTKESVVWDVGTGTGEGAISLAIACKQVIATDVSQVMLEYARKKAKIAEVDNVLFKSGGFFSGFRPTTHVDAVVTQWVLHHLPDFWKHKAIAAMSAALKPGGQLFLLDWVYSSSVSDYEKHFQNLLEKVRAKSGKQAADETAQHIKDEFSTFDWIMEGMITRNGLTIRSKAEQGLATTYVCEKV